MAESKSSENAGFVIALEDTYWEMGSWEKLAQKEKRAHNRALMLFQIVSIMEVCFGLLGMLEHAHPDSPAWALLNAIGIHKWEPIILDKFGGKSIFSLASMICVGISTAMVAFKFGKWWVPARHYRNELWLLILRLRAGLLTVEGFRRLRDELADEHECGPLQGAPNQSWLPTKKVVNDPKDQTEVETPWQLPPNSTWLDNDGGFSIFSLEEMVASLRSFKERKEGEVRRYYKINAAYTAIPIVLAALTFVLYYLEIFEFGWIAGHLSGMAVAQKSRLRLSEHIANTRKALVAAKKVILRAAININDGESLRPTIVDVYTREFRSWALTAGGAAEEVWKTYDRDRVEDAVISPRQAAQQAMDKATSNPS